MDKARHQPVTEYEFSHVKKLLAKKHKQSEVALQIGRNASTISKISTTKDYDSYKARLAEERTRPAYIRAKKNYKQPTKKWWQFWA